MQSLDLGFLDVKKQVQAVDKAFYDLGDAARTFQTNLNTRVSAPLLAVSSSFSKVSESLQGLSKSLTGIAANVNTAFQALYSPKKANQDALTGGLQTSMKKLHKIFDDLVDISKTDVDSKFTKMSSGIMNISKALAGFQALQNINLDNVNAQIGRVKEIINSIQIVGSKSQAGSTGADTHAFVDSSVIALQDIGKSVGAFGVALQTFLSDPSLSSILEDTPRLSTMMTSIQSIFETMSGMYKGVQQTILQEDKNGTLTVSTKIQQAVDSKTRALARVSSLLPKFAKAVHQYSVYSNSDTDLALNNIDRFKKSVQSLFKAMHGLYGSLIQSTTYVDKNGEKFVQEKMVQDFNSATKAMSRVISLLRKFNLTILEMAVFDDGDLKKASDTMYRMAASIYDLFTAMQSLYKPLRQTTTFKDKSTGQIFIQQKQVQDFASATKAMSRVLSLIGTMTTNIEKVVGLDINKFSGRLTIITYSLAKFVTEMSKVSKWKSFQGFQRLANAMQKVSTASKNLVTSTQKAKTSLKKLQGTTDKSIFSFKNLHPVVRQVFTAFAGYNVIYSFVRAIQAAVKASAQMQYAMARINTIVKTKSSALIQKWSEDVMKLSSEYGIAKNDITKALYEINSATIIGADAMKVLKASVAAARAGFTDTTRVAELLSKVINAYGYSANDAGYLSDVLFRTVQRGINTMEQLSQYMGRVVTVAANAGVSFEDINAAIATMTSRGLQTNIAVTALNSAILKMSQGSQKLDPLFRKMGYASAAAALQTDGLQGALKVLYEQTRGSTQALTKLGFNYRDIRAVSVLASDAFEAFGHNLDYITKASGATDDALKQVKDTLQYKWQSLKQTVYNAFIAFQNSAGATQGLKDIVDALKQAVVWTTQLFTATSDNLTVTQSFVRLMIKLGASVVIVKNMTKAWVALQRAIRLTTIAVGGFSTAFKAALVGTGVGIAVVAVLTGIQMLWNKITGQTQKAADALQNYFTQFKEIGESYRGALQSAIAFVNAPLEDFKQALSQVNTAVGDLKTKLEALEAERKGLIDAGQDVPEQLEKEIAYYKKQIEVLDKLMQKQAKRRRDLLSDRSYKNRLNVTSALKNISEQYQKTLQKQTSALQDYTKALIELAIIRKQLGRNGIGINIDLIGTNRAVFEEQVLKATPNLDPSDMSALIKLRQVFQKFGKTTKQATSQIQKLSKAFSNLQIPNNQFKVFYQLQRKVKEVESKRRNIVAVGSQTISKEVQDDLNKYAGKITVAQWNAQQQKNIRKLQYNLNVARFKHARHNAQLSLDLANQGDVQLLDHLNSLGAVSSQGFVSSQFASKLQKLTDTDTFRKLLTWTSIPGNKAGAFLVTPESLKAVKQQIKSRIEKRKNLMQDPIRKSIPEQYLPQYAELEDKSPEGAARFLEAKSLRKMLKANIEKVYDEFNRNMITAVKSGDASNVKSVFQRYGISDAAQQAQILKTTSITSGQIYDSLQPVIYGKQKLEDWVKRMTDFGKKVGISEDALKDYTKALWDIANDALHLQQAYQNTMDNLSKIRYASDEQYVKALQDLIVNTKKQEPSISQVSQNYKDIAKSNPLLAPAEAMNKAVNSVTQFANLNAEQKKAIAASAGLVLQAQQSIKKIQQRDKKEGEMKVPEAIRAQTAMSLGSSEFVNMFLSQTTETPQQKSLKSIDSTSKRILKSVNKSANINASLVII